MHTRIINNIIRIYCTVSNFWTLVNVMLGKYFILNLIFYSSIKFELIALRAFIHVYSNTLSLFIICQTIHTPKAHSSTTCMCSAQHT